VSVAANLEHDGAVLRLVVSNGRGNIYDSVVCDEVMGALGEAANTPGLRCVVLEGGGAHFSFGASVEEHAPDQVRAMLPRFHALIRAIVNLDVLVVALVRGQCLGGGLEVAAGCSVILAEEGAKFGQPEIKLGVIAPAASVLLPSRIAPAAAEDLLLTGRSIDARSAHAMGLVSRVFDFGGGEGGLQAWLSASILPRSAVALKFALHAVRAPLRDAVNRRLQYVEDLYLDELMATEDAPEGITAFLEKREPTWTHR
jgi:cyclohexa-1,5-dienecarbonyl-CoA hydratase